MALRVTFAVVGGLAEDLRAAQPPHKWKLAGRAVCRIIEQMRQRYTVSEALPVPVGEGWIAWLFVPSPAYGRRVDVHFRRVGRYEVEAYFYEIRPPDSTQ